MKICTHCSVEKPEEEFDFRPDRPGKRKAHCKDCRRAKVRAYDEKNKESKRAYNKMCREQNLDLHRDRARQHYWDNRGYKLSYLRSWRAENPHILVKHRKIRKEKLSVATPDWLTEDHIEEMRQIYLHAKDCRVVTGEIYEVDHIIPLQGKNVCGLHVPWNLQVLPQSVNRSKSNKLG